MRYYFTLLAALLSATPALAQDADELCVDRPGLGTPPCVLPQGQGMAELGVVGWEHRADPTSIEDELTYGELLVRYGVGGGTEFEVGLSALETQRQRERSSPMATRISGVGDVTLAVRHNLAGGDGPVAVHAFVTLPTGAAGIGAGDWGAGVLVPIALELPSGFELGLTPEIDAAVNASGRGRHLAWGGVIGLGRSLTSRLSLGAEVGAWRDEDPTGHATDAQAAVAMAWRVAEDWQVDGEVQLGLTSDAPRHALFMGLARRFR
jgi:hypothetical protein